MKHFFRIIFQSLMLFFLFDCSSSSINKKHDHCKIVGTVKNIDTGYALLFYQQSDSSITIVDTIKIINNYFNWEKNNWRQSSIAFLKIYPTLSFDTEIKEVITLCLDVASIVNLTTYKDSIYNYQLGGTVNNDILNQFEKKITYDPDSAGILTLLRSQPNKLASAYIANNYCNTFKNKFIIEKIYNALSESNKNSKYGKQIHRYLIN
jgi:hypothetical protein